MSLADYSKLRRPPQPADPDTAPATNTNPNTGTDSGPGAHPSTSAEPNIGTSLGPNVNPSTSADPSTNANPEQEPKEQMKKELIDVTEYKHEHKDEREEFLTPTAFKAKKKAVGKFENFSLCLRRLIRWEKKKPIPELTHLEIRDPAIQKAIRACLRNVRYIDLYATPIKIWEPFRELFWFRTELEEYKNSSERTSEDRESIQLLSDFIGERLYERIKGHEDVVKNGCIQFKFLWTIFRPGSIIFSVADGWRQAYLVSQVSIFPLFFQITCFEWNCYEDQFGLVETNIRIDQYTGTCPILELDIFPLDSLPEVKRKAFLEEQMQRGRRWKELTSQCHKIYEGVAWKLERKETEQNLERLRADLYQKHELQSYTRTRFHVNGRIVLDHALSLQFISGSMKPLHSRFIGRRPKAPVSHRSTFPSEEDLDEIFNKVTNRPSYEISDFQALLTPRIVRGYSLEDKCWMDFVVEQVKDIQWDTECFGKLQIDSLARSTLESLIYQHGKSNEDFKDIVVGKGKGLTILLHGPPGSGKTLTAEVISEHTRKPLLRVTSGELGTGASDAESQLNKAFKLAQAWQAILLLDEADVFLAKRRSEDIVRNAFVTVFLRSMEYYSGILLLTTNRVEDFDNAFQSRIHLQLPYILPDAHRRVAIWKNILGSQNSGSQLDDSVVERLGHKLECNGREIKNLIFMALSISQSQKKPLSEEIIEGLYQLNFGKKDA